MKRFSEHHPAVTLLHFCSVLLVAMFTINPVLLVIAMGGGMTFYLKINKKARNKKVMGFYIMLFVLISITNPLFSHNGTTPLFFLNGNPITLEALLYGMDIGIMLISVIAWFGCFNQVITEDKLLFLFGRFFPKLALLLSTALRFIPLFKEQAEKIRQTQKTMGLFSGDDWLKKIKGTLRVYSALITWALENAIDTGSSMKARGYGLKGRTVYSMYSFRCTDGILLGVVLVLDIIIGTALISGHFSFAFYPQITKMSFDIYGTVAVISFAILSFLPFILEVKEDLQWKYYRSNI